MRRRDGEDQIQSAIDIGRRNQEILTLAGSWCRHLKLDRRHSGVGVVEQQTGLPIGGGMFRCDYAVGPSFSGMQLEGLALDFYASHCRTCTMRAPVGLFPNLGTWAEPRLKEREARSAEAGRAREAAEAVRAVRRAQRQLIAGQLGPVARDVIDTVNALDANQPPSDAARDLAALAQLHPEAFDDAIVDILILDLDTHRLPGILECLVALNRSVGRPPTPQLEAVALRCLLAGVSTGAAAAFLAEDGSAAALAAEAVRRAATHLAGLGSVREAFHSRQQAQPALLLRLHRDDAVATERSLSEGLRHGDGWRRAEAAHAAATVVMADRAAGLRLLPALLDGLCLPDNSRYAGDAFPAAELATTASMVLVTDAEAVDREVDMRWARADADGRRLLLRVYDREARGRIGEPGTLPEAAANAIARRAVMGIGDVDTDVMREASDLIDLLGDYHSASVTISGDSLLGCVVVLAERLDEAQAQGMGVGPLAALERTSQLTVLAGALRETADGVAALVAGRPEEFWPLIRALWDVSTEGCFREFALRIVERCARHQDALPLALPYLYSGALAAEPRQRSQAFGSIARLLPVRAVVPDLLRDVVLRGLSDQYISVIRSAVGAIRHIELDPEMAARVVDHLMLVAASYAAQREHDQLVTDSLWAAMAVAEHIGRWEEAADAALAITHRMPAHSAAEFLSRAGRLRSRPSWQQEAAHAIRVDDDPGYAGLGDRERDELLAAIAERGSSDDALAASLFDRGLEWLEARDDREWAWRTAEALATVGAFAFAERLAAEVVRRIPDTLEERYQRLLAEQVRFAMTLESRIAQGDVADSQAALAGWREAETEAQAAREDMKRAEQDLFMA